MNKHNTMLTLTSKSLEMMFLEGGCGQWRAKESSILACRYLVATRNSRSSWSQGDESHGAAVMIGEISGVTPVGNRFTINFSRFAEIIVSNVWIPAGSNPIRYVDINETGINLEEIDWKAWPSKPTNAIPVSENVSSEKQILPLTISEAKKGLAMALGVEVDAIEIVIRG